MTEIYHGHFYRRLFPCLLARKIITAHPEKMMLGSLFSRLKWSLFRVYVSHQESNVHGRFLVCLKYQKPPKTNQKLKELVDG